MNEDLIMVVGKLADTVKNGGVTVLNQEESKALLDRMLTDEQPIHRVIIAR